MLSLHKVDINIPLPDAWLSFRGPILDLIAALDDMTAAATRMPYGEADEHQEALLCALKCQWTTVWAHIWPHLIREHIEASLDGQEYLREHFVNYYDNTNR